MEVHIKSGRLTIQHQNTIIVEVLDTWQQAALIKLNVVTTVIKLAIWLVYTETNNHEEWIQGVVISTVVAVATLLM